MSLEERMYGHGKVSQEQFGQLHRALIEAYKKDVAGIEVRVLEREELPAELTQDTLRIPIVIRDEDEAYPAGEVVLNPKTRSFRFEIYELNHAVENGSDTEVMKALWYNLNTMSNADSKYGAETVYEDECNDYPRVTRYGGWR